MLTCKTKDDNFGYIYVLALVYKLKASVNYLYELVCNIYKAKA